MAKADIAALLALAAAFFIASATSSISAPRTR